MLWSSLQAVSREKMAENYKYAEEKRYGGQLEMPNGEESPALLLLLKLDKAPHPQTATLVFTVLYELAKKMQGNNMSSVTNVASGHCL